MTSKKVGAVFFFTPSVQLCDLHVFQMHKLLHLR